MPRSQCENENVQFVQELAEVDGPFESPININYRDLTKLELPSLCWNRSETCPQKMKITNTGHTVIISGKWKCERPFLTGGPLVGKYVFSQIHFHWGQDECKGSEHQVCGEGFPLEMHVTHFKTDYLSQENALKEKDGMVIVAYLFKLQNEPNPALKKVISLLPCIQQPCTSQAFEPRPIMSLINPFTDDYFMYWGSVITPTCAHILLWMICREPFGISLEQVEEFRKILDSSQQPICKNSRDIQPLHKRNVFHVNACRDLDNPLLPIKQMLGCYCKGSEENSSLRSAKLEAPPPNECSCPVYIRNQEEIEETAADSNNENLYSNIRGTANWDSSLSGSAYLKQYVYVQNAIITPAPLLAKKFESELIKKVPYPETKQIKSENNVTTNLASQSCCFFPMEKINQIKPRSDRRKNREKKKSNSFKAFSNILSSLEALKNHTFKKLKEIDAMNKEIQGMKSFCQNAEDKHWLWKIEKIMMTQKRFTVKKPNTCLGELKRLAKECNFDKLFDNKQFSTNRKYPKIIQIKNNENRNINPALPCPEVHEKKMIGESDLTADREAKFSMKSQKLIESFFEDIKETEELQQVVRKNLLFKKAEKIDNKEEAGDSQLVSENYITEKMFAMENLGDRFFTEVNTEVNTEEEKIENIIITAEESLQHQDVGKSEEKYKIIEVSGDQNDSVIPLRKAIELPKLIDFSKRSDSFENCFSFAENQFQSVGYESEMTSDDENLMKLLEKKKHKQKNTVKKPIENYFKKLNKFTKEKFQKELKTDDTLASIWYSSSNFQTDSTETQRMFIAEFQKTTSRGKLWKRKSSVIARISSKKISSKNHDKPKMKNFNFESYYMKKKKHSKNTTITSSCDLSSSSTETAVIVNKSKWKRFMKAQLKRETKKSTSSRTSESEMECRIISPKRKRLKLDIKKKNETLTEQKSLRKSKEILTFECDKMATKNTDPFKAEEAFEKRQNENEKVSGLMSVSNEPLEKYREAVTQTASSKIELEPFKNEQCYSNTKIHRTNSAESTKHLESSKRENYYQESEELAKIAKESTKSQIRKILVKNKSLTNLTNSEKFFSTKTPQRLFVENIDSRRKCFKELLDLKAIGTARETDSKICQEKEEEPGTKPQPVSTQNSKTNIPEVEEKAIETKKEEDTSKTAVKQADEEVTPPQIQREKSKIPLVKRYDKRFLRKKGKRTENPEQHVEEVAENHQRAESNHSLTNEKDKPDGDSVEVGDLQTSIFYPEGKSFSAESLNPLSRPLKRKNKKRPHICKRGSKHYIRKNPLGIKKPKQAETKSLQRSSMPNEEPAQDVAKYLKQNFVEQENPKEIQPKKVEITKKKGTKQDATTAFKAPEQNTSPPKQEIKPLIGKTGIAKGKSGLPKPTHDFIKRNKLMAGKYKRGSSGAEKPTESKPGSPKTKQADVKNTCTKENKEVDVPESEPNSLKPTTEAENTLKVKEKRTKIPRCVKKSEKTQECSDPAEAKGGDDAIHQEPENLNSHVLEMAVQKMPLPSTRFLPAYMMTSDLPYPLEIVQNQQMLMNKYLLNMDADSHVPDVLKENLKKEKSIDFLYKKDLEYLLTLQRCLHGEMSTNIENSMSYIKTLLSQEYNGTTVLADSSVNEPFDYYDSLHYSDSCNSGLVLIEMSDFLESSTSNSDLSGYLKLKQLDNLSHQFKDKIRMSKAPQDSGDSGIVNPTQNHNSPKDWHSDPNYDCQIFITLSANSNEGGTASQSTVEESSNGVQEVTSQSSSYLERGSSQSFTLKQQRKKRKENEISAEMKQKLLEILEMEIKREMGVEFTVSTEAPDERHVTYNLEDSDGNNRSPCIGSFDNMEVLAQISETMRQYLSNFNERELPPSADEAD